jgi:glyoxylase-like metal-dependent hydrolase (beta-lactamase superfamily II)
VKYEVQILKMGQCEVPGPEVYWMSGWNTCETLYFWMVVIRGGGKTAIINTGPPQDLTDMNEVWKKTIDPRAQMVRQEKERPQQALAEIGIRPQDVDYVLITPLQAYATGNIQLFSNARICISKRGWIEDFHAPKYEMHIPRRLCIPDDSLHYLEIRAPDKLRLLEDEDEILPGLKALWTGAHHRSSMAYTVGTSAGQLVASDCFFKYRNVEEMQPLGIMESLEECMQAYKRIKAEADILLPLYDPLAADRLKAELKGKLRSLGKEELHD